MNGSNEENFKEPLGDWLKSSFDQFELTPRPSLRKRVFGALPHTGKRIFYAALGLLTALLLGLYFVKINKKEIAVLNVEEKAIASQHSAPANRMAKSAPTKAPDHEVMPARKADHAVRDAFVFPSFQVRTNPFNDEMVAKIIVEQNSEPKLAPQTIIDSLPANSSETLLASLTIDSPKPLETSLPVWPEIAPDSSTLPSSAPKRKVTGWFLSVTPSQNFQMLYVRSNPQMIIENIRFAGLSSMQSKGIKIAAGLERWGFKWSAAYTFLQYRTRFDIGNQKIEMEQTGPDEYKITRQYTSWNEIEQKLHFIGLGVARRFDFQAPALRNYHASAGLEYTKSLSDNQGLAMANASFSRKLRVRAPFQLSAGPYIEVGLHDLKIKSLEWRYRPYQVGVSVTVSGVGKK
jgi:hypothetical protein